jgi:cytochrome c oxidase subunit 4
MGHHHVMPFKTNLIVFLSLVFLTVLTVYTAKFVDLGNFNIVLAMFIATVKVTLVLTWFMHLKGDKPLNKAIILSSFCFVALLAGICYSDYFFR